MARIWSMDEADTVLIAESRETAKGALEELAYHHSSLVREAVARNPSTPFETVDFLTGDDSRLVRNAALQRLGLKQGRKGA